MRKKGKVRDAFATFRVLIAQYKDKRHSTFTGGCGVVRGFGELFLEIFAWLRSARWQYMFS